MISNGRSAWLMLALIVVSSAAYGAVSPAEQQLLGRLDSHRTLADLKRLAEDVVTAPSPLGNGTVVSGSVEETALAENLAQTLRALGIPVRMEEFPVRAYRYGPLAVTANGAPLPAISLHATTGTWGLRDGVRYARGNGADGHRITAPLVDAGDGYVADYGRVGDVRGRVVLVRRDLRDWPPAQIAEAAQRGALAVLFHDHPGSESQPDALRQDSMWGHAQIPAVAISRNTAAGLARDLAAGPVQVELESRVDVGDGLSRNVVAELRGAELPDEWVVVSAHYDRWFQGAADNVSGVAALLEIARAIAGSGTRPRRSLLFVATGSEEAGLEDPERDWLAGSNAFVNRHPEVLRSAALVFNIDLLGWSTPTATLVSTPDIAAHQQALLEDLGYAGSISIKTPSSSAVDAWNYGVVGGAAMNHLFRLSDSYFPIYHTQMDVFRPERFEQMAMDLRLLTLSLWRAATERRLPVALTALADSVGQELAADALRTPRVSFAATRAAVADFRTAAAAVESSREADAAEQAGRLLRATRHALVPWLYAANGEFEQAVRTSEYATRASALERASAAVQQQDYAAATKALREVYEGRECLQLSPEVYRNERAYWAGDGGWASRFGHRAPPPGPEFEVACAALAHPAPDATALLAALAAARTEAETAMAGALALMSAKLHLAAAELRTFQVPPAERASPAPRSAASPDRIPLISH